MVGKLRQTNLRQEVVDDVLARGRRYALALRAVFDVLRDRQPGKQRIGLEHHAPVGTGLGHRLAADLDHAGGAILKAGDEIEQARLAATGRADQRRDPLFGNIHRHISDGMNAAVM
ncbi:hypothetical protein SDC9_139624 [bioreactor metagenome]|uniref:Uncharacterized protein n=1 Tax=bioreactor metagenome TaxID=1076179 RepID=A0A645DT85_9ZZZZ